MSSSAPSTATRRSTCREVSQWIQSVNTVASKFLGLGLVCGEAVFAAQALGHALRLEVGPFAVPAAVRAGDVVEIGAHDEMALPAFRTNQVIFAFKLRHTAD